MGTYTYKLLAETITSDEDGQTIEGSYGMLDHLDEYVPMDGYCGSVAAKVLRDNTRTAEDLDELLRVVDDYGPADHVDERGDGEVIIYLADLPRVDDDEPYVRAIAVEGPGVAAALGIDDDEREAFAAYVETVGEEYATADGFRDAYRGAWDSIEDYASELVEDCGVLHGADEVLARYFDLAAFARDLVLGGDVYAVHIEGAFEGVYVFDAHA